MNIPVPRFFLPVLPPHTQTGITGELNFRLVAQIVISSKAIVGTLWELSYPVIPVLPVLPVLPVITVITV